MLNKRCMRTNANKWKCLLNSLFWRTQRDIEAPHYWPLVTGIHRWPVESHHKRHHSKNCDPDIFRNGCTGLIFCYGIGVVRNPMQEKAQYAKEVPYDASLSFTKCRSFCLGLHRYDNVMTWTEMLSTLLTPFTTHCGMSCIPVIRDTGCRTRYQRCYTHATGLYCDAAVCTVHSKNFVRWTLAILLIICPDQSLLDSFTFRDLPIDLRMVSFTK